MFIAAFFVWHSNRHKTGNQNQGSDDLTGTIFFNRRLVAFGVQKAIFRKSYKYKL